MCSRRSITSNCNYLYQEDSADDESLSDGYFERSMCGSSPRTSTQVIDRTLPSHVGIRMPQKREEFGGRPVTIFVTRDMNITINNYY